MGKSFSLKEDKRCYNLKNDDRKRCFNLVVKKGFFSSFLKAMKELPAKKKERK